METQSYPADSHEGMAQATEVTESVEVAEAIESEDEWEWEDDASE